MPLTPCLRCGLPTRDGSYCARQRPKPHLERPSPSSQDRPHPRLRAKVKARDGGRCVRCGTAGSPSNPIEVHHRQRVADGGGHDPENLEACCARCNRRLDAAHRRARRVS